MSDERMAGIPDPEGEYYAKVEFGRRAAGDETEDKVYLKFEYPNLPYGGMVGLQKMMQEQLLPDLVKQGELVAELMGQPVQSMEEVNVMLDTMKAGRGKAQGQGQGQGRK